MCEGRGVPDLGFQSSPRDGKVGMGIRDLGGTVGNRAVGREGGGGR